MVIFIIFIVFDAVCKKDSNINHKAEVIEKSDDKDKKIYPELSLLG